MNRTLNDELADARAAQVEGDIGRARTCSRRAVGMTIRASIGIGPGVQNYASSFIDGLRKLSEDPAYPEKVREAATRLCDRSKEDRTSASHDPVNDAEIILQHFGVVQG